MLRVGVATPIVIVIRTLCYRFSSCCFHIYTQSEPVSKQKGNDSYHRCTGFSGILENSSSCQYSCIFRANCQGDSSRGRCPDTASFQGSKQIPVLTNMASLYRVQRCHWDSLSKSVRSNGVGMLLGIQHCWAADRAARVTITTVRSQTRLRDMMIRYA